jgi:hypothetical protein
MTWGNLLYLADFKFSDLDKEDLDEVKSKELLSSRLSAEQGLEFNLYSV